MGMKSFSIQSDVEGRAGVLDTERGHHLLDISNCTYVHYLLMGGDEMVKGTRLLAEIDPELKKRLYRVLLEEDLTFSEWLRRQIDQYLAEKEPKGKRRKGKELR